MLQLVVKAKRMNVRRVIPSILPDPNGIVGTVHENFVFEGEEVPNVPNPDLGKWYKDKNGHFYWGGGLQKFVPQTLLGDIAVTAPIVNYNRLLQNIPEEWKLSEGKGVTVAILDSGFNIAHTDLTKNVVGTFNAVDKSENVFTNKDHGNMVAGLIAANSNTGIRGIAPQAKMILVKIADNNGVIMPSFVKNGLEHILTNTNADIINISLSLNKKHYAPLRDEFLKLFAIAEKQKVLVVASAGENSGLLLDRPEILLPANEDTCLAIGTVNKEFVSANLEPSFNKRLTHLIPDLALKSTASQNSTHTEIRESSMAAAVLSGVLALIISHEGTRIEKKEAIIKLNQHLNLFNAQSSLSNLNIFKL